MRQVRESLVVETDGQGLYEISDRVRAWVAAQDIRQGLLTIYLHHTSASLLIQENADPDVLRDLHAFFQRIVPEDVRLYRHNQEGPDDMPAHIRAALDHDPSVDSRSRTAAPTSAAGRGSSCSSTARARSSVASRCTCWATETRREDLLRLAKAAQTEGSEGDRAAGGCARRSWPRRTRSRPRSRARVSRRAVRLTAGPIVVKSRRLALPILPYSTSPRCSAMPWRRSGSPASSRSRLHAAMPTRTSSAAASAASQAAVGIACDAEDRQQTVADELQHLGAVRLDRRHHAIEIAVQQTDHLRRRAAGCSRW